VAIVAKPQTRKSAAVAERRAAAAAKSGAGSGSKAAPARRPTFRAPLPTAAAEKLEGRTRGLTTWARDVRSELRKVVWPTREQALKLTAVVVVLSVIVGFFLGIVDAVFSAFITWLLQ
jgi:preprotein translocase subunit SecE